MKPRETARVYRCPCGEIMELKTMRRTAIEYLICPACGLLSRTPDDGFRRGRLG